MSYITLKDALLASAEPAPTDNDTWNALLESRAKLERELKASYAREGQLRAALQALYDLGSLELPHRRDPALQAAFDALSLTPPPACATCKGHGLIGGHTGQTPETFDQWDAPCPDCPPPPVVPVEDVKPLLEALTKIVKEQFYPMSQRLTTDAGIAEQDLSTFTTKHPIP